VRTALYARVSTHGQLGQNWVTEAVLNIQVTAHILGGVVTAVGPCAAERWNAKFQLETSAASVHHLLRGTHPHTITARSLTQAF
jgi:hypothetical protein